MRLVYWLIAALMAFISVGCTTLGDNFGGAAGGLEGVWPATRVYLPDRPNVAIRVHDPEFTAGPAQQDERPLPTVIFLHGCSGYREGASQAAYPHALARAGFAVFVPDSFARPGRVPACGNVRIDTVNLRRAEVRETIRRLREILWVDQRNLFLAGHSEGGIATAMYGGGECNAYFIAG